MKYQFLFLFVVSQEQSYKDQLEVEIQQHSNTKNSLESIRKELEASKEENNRITKRNEELLNKFKNEVINTTKLRWKSLLQKFYD